MRKSARAIRTSILLGLTLILGSAAHALGGAGAPPAVMLGAPPCGLPAQSIPAGAAGARPTVSDVCFAQQAALGDLFEIQSSQLALTRASSPDVRAYAQQLIVDHTAASQRLKTLAAQLQVPLPAAPQGPHATKLAELRSLQGAAFDQAYMTAQVAAHEQAVSLFTAYSRSGNQPQLRAHAVQTLPHLRMHLERARTLLGAVTQ